MFGIGLSVDKPFLLGDEVEEGFAGDLRDVAVAAPLYDALKTGFE